MILLLLATVAALFSCGEVMAAEPAGYYDKATGKSGAALRAALHGVIRNHTTLPYAAPSGTQDTSDALAVLDQSPGDVTSVRLVYSGLILPKSTFAETAGWNREHLWPNSYGIDDVPPSYSDLHNLRAIDATVNSSRGNLLYDESDTNGPGFASPGHAEAPGTSRDSDNWEPRESEKGDLARVMFYMAVRYEGDAPSEPDLELTDDLATVTSAGVRMGRLTTLIEWSLLDPVSEEEETRNDAVFTLYQHNRNPFVDHPEWVTLVFGNPLWLEMESTPAGIVLRWPAGLRRAVLESSSDLKSWEVLTVPVTSAGGISRATDARQLERHFYRLLLQ